MNSCEVINNMYVPLSRVVNASIVDVYGDISKLEQRYSHWAARGLKKLYRESLPQKLYKVLLKVNANTHTATLPLDYYKENFVGYINNGWERVRISPNSDLVDQRNIADIPCDDKCEKCDQNKSICNDLVVTEEINLIVINNNTYEQTIIKKLYPNGDYYLQTTTPVLNIEDNSIDYPVTREFIANFDLKPCGCLEDTTNNTQNLQTYCPDIYCNYYSSCSASCDNSFSYRIFEETGLIQLSPNFRYDKVYFEYMGYIQKVKGQYVVPDVAFETLVEYVKSKAIDNKGNISLAERQYQKNNYRIERTNMIKVLYRVNLSSLIHAWNSLPKFDIDYGNWRSCFSMPNSYQIPALIAGSSSSNNTTEIINNTTLIRNANYTLAVKVDGQPGSPLAGLSVYQNNILKNALNINYIFLAKQTLTILDSDFQFDSVTGTINIAPNQFYAGDSLIVNYNKNS